MPKPATSYKAGTTPILRPYLVIRDTPAAIAFYERALGAREVLRMPGPDGKIVHAEIEIDGCSVYLTEENPAWESRSPLLLGGSPVSMMLYVRDVDAALATAVAAGAELKQPAADMFWGDRWGVLKDPFGHSWQFATHKLDMTPEEMKEAGKKAMAEMSPPS
jgi:uncharacterized glyoxalase superfamily protein PhnB